MNSTSVQQIEDATMVVGHMLVLRVAELVAAAAEESADEAVTTEEKGQILLSVENNDDFERAVELLRK